MALFSFGQVHVDHHNVCHVDHDDVEMNVADVAAEVAVEYADVAHVVHVPVMVLALE